MIFGGWGPKYFERGLNVIPCAGKAPVIKAWTRFAKEHVEEFEIESWVKDYPTLNIGLVLGPASGLVCLDIDDDALLDKLPRSPLTRRGKKGEGRFFKYREGMISRSFMNAKIDFLSLGKQTIIPPSIHPEGPEYVWLSEDWDNIPELPNDLLKLCDDLERAASRKALPPSSNGRNNRLKAIASAMFARGAAFDEVVTELLMEDDTHKPPLFTDPNESQSNKDPGIAATRFAASILASIGPRVGASLVPVARPTINFLGAITMPADQCALEAPIPIKGLLSDMFLFSERTARDKAPALFLGAGLAAMSAACSNRFAFRGIRSSNYFMNIGGTGKGKSEANRLFNHFQGWNIKGHETIEAAPVLLQGWDAREDALRTRVDLFDEFGSVLVSMARGNSFQLKIVDTMCRLRTASNKLFGGSGYATQGKSIPPVWNIGHVVLASTTMSRLRETYQREWTEAGFSPRFLMMVDETPRDPRLEMQIDIEEEIIDQDIVNKLNRIKLVVPEYHDTVEDKCHPFARRETLVLTPGRYRLKPRELKAGIGVIELLNMYIMEKARMQNELSVKDPDSSLPHFLSRHVEHVKGLCIIYAVSEGLDETFTVERHHLEQAIELVEWQYENAKGLFETLHVRNDWERDRARVLKHIQKAQKILRIDLMKITHFSRGDLDKIIETLWESNEIYIVEHRRNRPGRRAIEYHSGPEPQGDFARTPSGAILGDSQPN